MMNSFQILLINQILFKNLNLIKKLDLPQIQVYNKNLNMKIFLLKMTNQNNVPLKSFIIIIS